jgi:hypothetical protein
MWLENDCHLLRVSLQNADIEILFVCANHYYILPLYLIIYHFWGYFYWLSHHTFCPLNSLYTSLLREAWLVYQLDHYPLTMVAQMYDSWTPHHVSRVDCWLSPLRQRFFSGFPPSEKNINFLSFLSVNPLFTRKFYTLFWCIDLLFNPTFIWLLNLFE